MSEKGVDSKEWTHFLNSFRDDNRQVRKRGLQNVQKELTGKDVDKNILIGFLTDPAALEMLKLICDPIENIREKAAEILCEILESQSGKDELLDGLPGLKKTFGQIIWTLVQRIGQQQIVEQSEEIRLLLMRILHNIAKISAVTNFAESDETRSVSMLYIYLDEILQILEKTVIDPYPEVKKESCHCISVVAKNLPKGVFAEKSAQMIKPLLLTLSHQHYKVRALVVKTIGDVIMYGSGKSVPDVISHLAQRLFDQNPQVRSMVIQVVGSWLLDLYDRYSFHYQLMPLLLTGLSDELPEIREEADSLWHDIGIKYHHENEDSMKDNHCFGDKMPSHYPAGVERPPLGCRMLMYHHFSKILPAATRDMSDWVEGTRIKASELLYFLVLNNEVNLCQHLDKLLTALYTACKDDLAVVRQNGVKAAELTGVFVPVKIWSELVLPRLDSGNCEILMTMAALIRGAERGDLCEHLDPITEKMQRPEFCQTVSLGQQMSIVDIMDSFMQTAKEDITPFVDRLFEICMTVLALAANESVSKATYKTLENLGQLCFGSKLQLYEKFTKPLLEKLSESSHDWNLYSVEAKVFATLLLEAENVSFKHLDVALPTFKTNSQIEINPELRVNLFTVMSKMMTKACEEPNLGEVYRPYVSLIVNDILLPNLIWKAGRTASAVRSSAIACLWCFMKLGLGEIGNFFSDNDGLVTKILPILTDDNQFTRLVTCKVLKSIFYTYCDSKPEHLSNEFLKALLALLKIMDDPANDIRVAGCETMLAYLECFKGRSDRHTYSGHIDEMIQGLLIHLDDPHEKVQEAVSEVLKELAEMDPKQMTEKLTQARGRHRNVRPCDELLKYVEKLKV